MTAGSNGRRLWVAFAAVAGAMAVWLSLPSEYFIAATFAVTTLMVAAAYATTRFRGLLKPTARTLAAGLGSALLLYAVFYAGNAAVQSIHPLGISSASENAIYSLIASPSNPVPLQVGVLLFDAVGYESFFRGALQSGMTPRLGAGAPVAAALADAAIHAVTLNPLWVVTTFIVDLGWGLTYLYTKDLTASGASHLAWDLMIFVLLPIK